MRAVYFSNCENLRISFERKHNLKKNETPLNGKNTCVYSGALHIQIAYGFGFSHNLLYLLKLLNT